jgi:hypothetical protein
LIPPRCRGARHRKPAMPHAPLRVTSVSKPCPQCGPTKQRCDTVIAVGLVGLLVGIVLGAGHGVLAAGNGPQPLGLYIVAIGAAVAALWLIVRTFPGRHCVRPGRTYQLLPRQHH